MSTSIYTTNKNECRFNPVQCTWDKFETLTAQDGFVYFVTDKKKLFLGKNKEMIPMCASSGIFYGKKPVEYDNSGNKPDPKVTFVFNADETLSEIEGPDKPELDDLILNVGTPEYEDGCFYRVVNIVDDAIETTRLTLQGTGGGGGGGGSTGGSTTFTINIVGTTSKVYSSTATTMPVSFKGYYNGAEENRISQVKFTRKGELEPFYIHTEELAFNTEHTLDLFKFMNMFGSTRTTVTIAITDLYGTERSTNFTIQIVELALKATKDDLLYSMTTDYVYACNLSGATTGVSNKKITYTFYAENNLNVPAIPPQVRELATSDEGEIQKSLDLSGLSHGIYVLEIEATALIGASNTTLFSNKITHKIARFNTANNQPLLMVKLPDVTEQYTNIPLRYMLVTAESDKSYHLNIKLDGNEKTELAILSNKMGTYPLYFEEKGTYTLLCTAVELAVNYQEYLNIVEYTGNLPVIDPTRDDLLLYLNPRGKSNSSTDRNEWKDYNGHYTANLYNLHYGEVNGWMMDDDGTSFLKLSSGAYLQLPEFKPFAHDPTKASGADSRMGYGMTIEIDFAIDGVLDFDEDIISCYSTDSDHTSIPVGFRIMGDKVQFFNSRLNNKVTNGENIGSLMSLNLVEGKRTRISFVIEPNTGKIAFPMCYAYLNGKLSGAVIYDSGDNFKDSTNPAYLNINAENAQVKIYGIRFYSSALNDKLILNNYTASLPTLAERQTRFDSNNVFNAAGNVDYTLVAAEEYNLQIPYMKITGGWATEKDSKWQLKNQTTANVGLPTGKKDYRLIDVEVKYPNNTLFEDYEDYKFVNKFASGKPMATAFGEKPSNGGAIMYAQGTSSMEYPVKNLRLRFKKDEDFYVVRPDIAPVEIICMKADYMESSGSHNTGAANFVDALYEGAGIKTPGQAHNWGDGKKIVTCIKGYPCLIFYSESGEAGTYKYIGKYNLNLDKATPEPFGFNHDKSDFGYLPVGEKYWAVTYDDDGEEFIGQENPAKGGDYVASKAEEEKVVKEGEKINSIHCFEFLDNAVEVCNFLPKKGYTYENTWYGQFLNSENKLVPGWTLGFESRYPEDRVGTHDADMLWPLAKWLNELKVMYDDELSKGGDPKDITYTYDYTRAVAYQDFVEYFIKIGENEYESVIVNSETFPSGEYYTRSVASSRFGMNSLERFKREYQCYLDKDFLLTYYLVTEALLMADSRVKNMMIATWEKKKSSYISLEGNTIPTNNYIFYPIFYDMDTMLGLDNTGVYRFNYYDEDTNASVFNGDEVLWNFVRDALIDELRPWYSELESASLSADKILPYFNDNQADMANEAFYNGDAMYKYVRPAREGYQDLLNDKYIEPGEAPFLYAAQGDRSLMREWFLTNRMKFLRGKYNSTKYQNGDRIEFRWYYPSGTEDEFAGHSASVAPGCAKPDGTFEFTSLKTSYAGVKLGANGNVYNERFNGEETKEITLPEASSANGTEAYLLGLSSLTDLGDLSNKYMQKFIIASDDCRLKHLTLGNPHKDYYNPYWKPKTGQQSQKIGISGCTYLESFNLQNCVSYNNVMDFSGCPAIERILLTGSSTSGVTLPVNGVIKELRLPATVTQLKIVSHSQLKDEGFSIGSYNYGSANKIGEGVGYVNDFSNLTELYIVDTPINTYPMILDSTKTLSGYYLQGFDWTIEDANEMYCRLNSKEFVSGNTYYEYINGVYQSRTFTNWPADDNIYKLVSMKNGDNIVNIPVLDYLYTKTYMAGTTVADALNGTITINVSGSADELALYQKYNAMYPNVKIKYGSKVTVTNAIRVSFYRVDKKTLEESGSSLSGIEPYFTTLTGPNTQTIAQLIGDDLTPPIKSASNTRVYEFTGRWYDWNDNKTVYYQDEYFENKPDANKMFSTFKPNGKDMLLVPEFAESVREYTVKFYDWDYEFGKTPIFTLKGQYENHLTELNTGDQYNPRLYYLYRPDDDSITGDNRYTFKGWQNESDFNNNVSNPALIDLDKVQLRSDLNYFAYYVIENATEVASDSVLFEFKKESITCAGNTLTNQYNIGLKPEYRNIVGGKITLPTANGANTITAIRNFNDTPLLTGLYALPSAQHQYIADNAFAKSAIEQAYLPKSLVRIGAKAFENANKLEVIDWTDCPITHIGIEAFKENGKLVADELPSTLTYIGDRAFLNAEKVSFSEIPESLNELNTQCFMGCTNIKIDTFPARPEGTKCVIGYGAFYSSTAPDVTKITINKPWTIPNEVTNGVVKYAQPFGQNGYSSVSEVAVYADLITDEEELRKTLFGELRGGVGIQLIGE